MCAGELEYKRRLSSPRSIPAFPFPHTFVLFRSFGNNHYGKIVEYRRWFSNPADDV